MTTPRIEIDFSKIAHNAKKLKELYGSKGIDVIGVTKVVCGDPKNVLKHVRNPPFMGLIQMPPDLHSDTFDVGSKSTDRNALPPHSEKNLDETNSY